MKFGFSKEPPAKLKLGEPSTRLALPKIAWELVPRTDQPQLSSQSRTVLVVDDDAVILRTAAARLQAAGYQVITAADPAEAIGAVREKKPDFILLDIDFPPDVASGGCLGWDGFRLMYWLRGLQNTAGARFIIITGTGTDEFRERALTAGAKHFFTKPIDFGRLVSALQ
jgi:CheY-like chemotaxis protein